MEPFSQPEVLKGQEAKEGCYSCAE